MNKLKSDFPGPIGLHAILGAARRAVYQAERLVPDAPEELFRLRMDVSNRHQVADAVVSETINDDGNRPELTVTHPSPLNSLPIWLATEVSRPNGLALLEVLEALQVAAVRAADAAVRTGEPWRDATWSSDGLDQLSRWFLHLLGPEVQRAVTDELLPSAVFLANPGLWLDSPTLDGLGQVVGDGFGVPAMAELAGRRTVRLHVGPLPRDRFEFFHPTRGCRFRPLACTAGMYLGDGMAFEIGLWLQGTDVPAWVPDSAPADGIWVTDSQGETPDDAVLAIPARKCLRAVFDCREGCRARLL